MPPFAPQVELFAGQWVDITSRVRHESGISIDRGKSAEASNADPSTCGMVLDNRDGWLSPRNRGGGFHGLIGRNSPLRVSVRSWRDAFDRTSSAGWGTGPDGQAWTSNGSGGSVLSTDYSVGSGSASHSVPATVAYRQSWAAGLSCQDVDVSASFRLPGVTSVTGGVLEPCNLLLRGQAGVNNYYMVRVTITTAQAFQVALYRQDSTLLATAQTVPGLSYVAGATYRVRAQAEGQAFRAKVWRVAPGFGGTADGEPLEWHNEVTTNWILPGGYVGIRSGVGSGNSNTKPVQFVYDEIVVRHPRFAGEVASWPVEWDESGRNAWASIEAAGVTRRLAQSKEAGKSALRRAIEASGPTYYWPLDDGEDVESATPAAGDVPLLLEYMKPGSGELAPWLGKALKSAGRQLTEINSFVIGRVRAPGLIAPTTSTWSLSFAFRAAHRTGDELDTGSFSVAVDGSAQPMGVPQATFSGAIDEDIVGDLREMRISVAANRAGISGASALVPYVFDDRPHIAQWTFTASGGNTNYSAHLDGVQRLSGTLATPISPPSTPLLIDWLGWVGGDVTFGDLTIWTGVTPSAATLYDALLGNLSEAARDRLIRLAAEADVSMSVDHADTARMGRQGDDPFAALLAQAADVDGGVLLEQRGTTALRYRPLAGLYNQAPSLTLDHDTPGHLRPGLQPVEDDRNVRNDITVTRTDGSSARVTKTEGPLSALPIPDGVGVYDASIDLPVESDEQALQAAAWRVHLGTWDEPRYNGITVSLRRIPALITAAAETDLGDVIRLAGLPAWAPAATADVMVTGVSERISEHAWDISWSSVPAGPYRVAVLDSDELGKLDTSGSELVAAIATSTAGVSEQHEVAVTDGPMWVTAAGEFPFEALWGSEVVNVTGIAVPSITYVSAGTAVHADNADITPGMPAGWAAGNLLLALCAHRTTTGSFATPAGWELVGGDESVQLFARVAQTGDTAPLLDSSAPGAGSTTSAQIAAFGGRWHNTTVIRPELPNSQRNDAAQNIASPPNRVLVGNSLVIRWAWKQDDWTSVTAPAGTLIGSPSSTLGNDQGIAWSYEIQTTATPVAAGTWTVTGGASAISRAGVVSLRCDKQLWTVTRGADGWAATHTAGDPVRLAHPLTLAL